MRKRRQTGRASTLGTGSGIAALEMPALTTATEGSATKEGVAAFEMPAPTTATDGSAKKEGVAAFEMPAPTTATEGSATKELPQLTVETQMVSSAQKVG